MRNACKKACLASLALTGIILGLAGPATSTTFIVPSDDELIIEARAIIRGKVLSISSQLDPDQDRVFTYITVRVREVLKGQVTTGKITLKEAGGEVGDRACVVFGAPSFSTGEKVLLYLNTWRDGSLRVHQMFLGKFSITTDEAGTPIVTRNTPDAGVNILGRSQSGPATSRMELSEYTSMVRERLTANASNASEFESTYYSNVPVLRRPPEYEGLTGRGSIQPNFRLWAPPGRWFEPDSGSPVVFKTNPEGAPDSQVLSDATAAMNAWSTVQGCSLRVVDGGQTTGCGLFNVDGENTISFNNCDGYFPPGNPCSSGILAIASFRMNRSLTRIVNGVSFGQALESNISFNPNAACHFDNHCNVAEILTHEMGHGLGLHHSWDPSFGGTSTAVERAATMYYIAHFDGRCASLRPDDVNGIIFIYPASGPGAPPVSIVTSFLAGATVDVPYSQTLTASGGSPPYVWSLVSGTGSTPPGLSLSSGGTISGSATTAGTFAFTVNVTDSASRTAQKALSIVVSPAALQITTSTVPSAIIGLEFSHQLTATGGKPPYNWTVSAGSIPTGLALGASNGIISGTPLALGTFVFAVDLTDSESRVARRTLSIEVKQPPLSISTATAMDALMGTAFSYQPTAAGGNPPYNWSISSGTLPDGFTLNPATGLISGTSQSVATFGFTLTVRDQANSAVSAPVQIRVLDPKTVPAISKVKKKPKKLLVSGSQIMAGAVLVVDGTARPTSRSGGKLKWKNPNLVQGRHEIRIVNPGDIPSQPYFLDVE